jgi:hypothetical protein
MLLINKVPVRRVKSAKILGVRVDNRLSFNEQINEVLKKANSKIYSLKQLKELGYNKKELEYFYNSVSLPSVATAHGAVQHLPH